MFWISNIVENQVKNGNHASFLTRKVIINENVNLKNNDLIFKRDEPIDLIPIAKDNE